MTERLHQPPTVGSYGPHSRPAQCTDEGLSTKKTVIVLMIIGACFAILWPKIFYPMLVGNAGRMRPNRADTGCCDVISEGDLDTIKIMSELCSTIIESKGAKPLTDKEIVTQCRKAVLETCGIDIAAALQDRISLGHSTKQILEEVRSLNGSLCLKYHFGVAPWKLGVPHRGAGVHADPANNIRQERSSQLRPAVIHPAFRERGRAIPEAAESLPVRRTAPPPRIIEGRPGPIPGMRPTMGGPGHVVTPSKQSSYGFMGVLMPLYTIGFVIFFAYTVMKLVFKKKPERYAGSPLYPPCDTDDDFRQEVFEQRTQYFDRPNKDNSKIVVNAVAALLEEVNKEIEAHKSKTPSDSSETEQEILKPNGTLHKEEDQGSITVMGMETTASSESGKKWARPDSPELPRPQSVAKEPTPPPQQIFLETALPAQSQILVSELEAQQDSENDSPVVLAGKMTLSVISLDSENSNEDSGSKRTDSDEERRTSSSNVSDEFEKINAQDLEDHVEEETKDEAVHAEDDFRISPVDLTTPPIGLDVVEEIKQQLQLEDDLLEVLHKESEPFESSVSDIVDKFMQHESERSQEEERDVTSSSPDDKDIKDDTARPLSGRLYRLGEPTMEEILREELQPNEDLDVIEQVIEEIHYEDDDGEDNFEEEERRLQEEERRVNGVASSEGSSRNGAEPSETAAENEISENELDDNEDDEEIEEIIEYVDNTDEEGEEVIEVNGNEARTNRNGNH